MVQQAIIGDNAGQQVTTTDLGGGKRGLDVNVASLNIVETYLGADRLTLSGSHLESTIPANAAIAIIMAETGDVRYAVNANATASSPGYIITGSAIKVGVAGATKLSLYGTAAYANILYFSTLNPAGLVNTGSERLTMNGTSKSCTIPAGSLSVIISAEGGDIRFAVNGAASSISPGYIIAGSAMKVPLVGIVSLSIFGATGAFANNEYSE